MADTMRAIRSSIGASFGGLAAKMAYLGGVIVAAIGLMSAVSIIGRSAISRPITGDFELVEIGTAVAGSLFLPYCQARQGHIVVDFFTLGASERVKTWLDRVGCLLMAITFLAIGWRTVIGCIDISRSGETSMLLGFPIWIGYAAAAPGIIFAGLTALFQAFGFEISERMVDE